MAFSSRACVNSERSIWQYLTTLNRHNALILGPDVLGCALTRSSWGKHILRIVSYPQIAGDPFEYVESNHRKIRSSRTQICWSNWPQYYLLSQSISKINFSAFKPSRRSSPREIQSTTYLRRSSPPKAFFKFLLPSSSVSYSLSSFSSVSYEFPMISLSSLRFLQSLSLLPVSYSLSSFLFLFPLSLFHYLYFLITIPSSLFYLSPISPAICWYFIYSAIYPPIYLPSSYYLAAIYLAIYLPFICHLSTTNHLQSHIYTIYLPYICHILPTNHHHTETYICHLSAI